MRSLQYRKQTTYLLTIKQILQWKFNQIVIFVNDYLVSFVAEIEFELMSY